MCELPSTVWISRSGPSQEASAEYRACPNRRRALSIRAADAGGSRRRNIAPSRTNSQRCDRIALIVIGRHVAKDFGDQRPPHVAEKTRAKIFLLHKNFRDAQQASPLEISSRSACRPAFPGSAVPRSKSATVRHSANREPSLQILNGVVARLHPAERHEMLETRSHRDAPTRGLKQIATIGRFTRSMSRAAAATPRSAADCRRTGGNGDLGPLAPDITAMAEEVVLISSNFPSDRSAPTHGRSRRRESSKDLPSAAARFTTARRGRLEQWRRTSDRCGKRRTWRLAAFAVRRGIVQRVAELRPPPSR